MKALIGQQIYLGTGKLEPMDNHTAEKKCSISLLGVHTRSQLKMNADSPPHFTPLPHLFKENPEAMGAALGTLWTLGRVARQTNLHLCLALSLLLCNPGHVT